MELNEGNKYCQKIKKCIQNDFNHSHTFFYKYLIFACEQIIQLNYIPITIIKDDKLLKKFIKYNNARIKWDNPNITRPDINNLPKNINGKIIEELSTKLIKLLTLYYESIITPKKVDDSFANKYVDYEDFFSSYKIDDETEEENKEINTILNNNKHLLDEVDVILPSSETTFQSILRNLFYNKNVKYAFNDKIENCKHIEEAVEIKTTKLKIISKGEDVELPTKYEWVCRAKTEYGECGNKIEFYEGHKHNTIKCNLNTHTKHSHTIKDVDKIPPKELRKLYCYHTQIIDGVDEEEYLTYSLLPIYKEIIECNYIYIGDKKSFIIILGYKYVNEEQNNVKNILIEKKENKWFFANDIFKSLQKYFKEHHKINITNQNKIVALYIIITAITKIFLNHRYHCLIVGKSGSGKSFIANIILNMLSFNTKTVMGTSITKNKFIGGRSNIISQFKNSLYEPGYIETKDFLVCEETTDLLDMIANPNIPTTDNLLTWIKMIDQGEIDRGIQGSRNAKPNASLLMFGNLENMKYLRGEIIKHLKRVYVRTTNGKTLQSLTTIYKPPQYYMEMYENEKLAKTHAIVREDFYNTHNHITGLPEAEQSRFTFFICLEDDDHGYTNKKITQQKQQKVNYHRYELLSELKEKFGEVKNTPMQLIEEVCDWMNNYLKTERNNYRFTNEKDVNTHMFNNMVYMLADIVYLNKKWYKNKNKKLTNEDKNLMKWVLEHNYNVLSKFEANLSTHPFINDCFFDVEDIRQQVEDDKIRFKQLLQKNRDESVEMEENLFYNKDNTNNVDNKDNTNNVDNKDNTNNVDNKDNLIIKKRKKENNYNNSNDDIWSEVGSVEDDFE